MKRSIGFFACLACLCCAVPLRAFDASPLVYRASILTILEGNELEGDLGPIMPSPGIAYSLPILPLLRFEPGLDFYYTFYGYSDALERAVPVSYENRSSAVWGLMLNLPFDFSFRIAGLVGFHASVGLTADLRVCLLADDSSDAEYENERAAAYFWGGGRWLLPSASFGFDFPFTDRYYLGVDLRMWYPWYRIWTGEDLPAAENVRFALGLRLASSAR